MMMVQAQFNLVGVFFVIYHEIGLYSVVSTLDSAIDCQFSHVSGVVGAFELVFSHPQFCCIIGF